MSARNLRHCNPQQRTGVVAGQNLSKPSWKPMHSNVTVGTGSRLKTWADKIHGRATGPKGGKGLVRQRAAKKPMLDGPRRLAEI